jgi:hypothetical protein
MKKLLVLTLVLLVVAACASTPTIKVGLGTYGSLKSSKAATAEAEGTAQVDITSCALAVDANGKIVGVSFDVNQGKVKFNATGAITTDLTSEVKSKKELGDAYGMKSVSGIGKEVYEQINALEAYMIGKTVSDTLAMKTYERDASHPQVPDVDALKSSVTITVGDYLKALDKANKNAK